MQSRIEEFKEKIFRIIRAMIEKQAVSGADSQAGSEETELDSEINRFADEVVKIQGNLTVRQSRQEHFGETRNKLRERLGLLSSETNELLAEQKNFEERHRAEDEVNVSIAEEERVLNESLLRLEESAKAKAKEKDALLVRLTETRSRQSHCAAKSEKAQKDRHWVLESKANEEQQLLTFEKEIEDACAKRENLESENVNLEEALINLTSSRDEILKQIETLRRCREDVILKLEELDQAKTAQLKILEEAKEKVHAYDLQNTELHYEMERIKERIFNAYQVDLTVQATLAQANAEAIQILGGAEPEFNFEEAKVSIQTLKDKLNRMGPVNLVAIQEYDEMKERYDFLTKQQQDLAQAKEDLHKAILRINRTTKEMFVETFANIQKYFSEYYKLLFGGGSAELVLLDEEDVLESGIEIVARPPGKKLQNITLLSGGEKALTAVALLFSLFKVKPSPFCVLDEIDAPLDESNVERFCLVVKEFVAESQFIVITHNKRTMNLADAMYGITMAETGVSKVVSVRFSEKAELTQDANANGRKEVLI
ncbi:MAG: hypothetical protein COT00_00775 [Candidatus Omnitrophica bacterium CG07_land_8_20_14_0_80_50_8]|nr:MAG: hypothetical protein COT00_00775 [Candidatus Omnitrophica bacterium CG07_land_8_20_14_0_80_50_8]